MERFTLERPCSLSASSRPVRAGPAVLSVGPRIGQAPALHRSASAAAGLQRGPVCVGPGLKTRSPRSLAIVCASSTAAADRAPHRLRLIQVIVTVFWPCCSLPLRSSEHGVLLAHRLGDCVSDPSLLVVQWLCLLCSTSKRHSGSTVSSVSFMIT